MTDLRLFVAVEPPREMRAQLYAALGSLRERYEGVKWEQEDKLHFTLKFLGEVSEAVVPQIEASLQRIAEATRSFPAAFGGVGCFPSLSRPRIIWAGLRQGGQEMSALQTKIERELVAIGFEPERKPFRPHLTVGRIKRRVRLMNLDEHELPARVFTIGEVLLKKSKLTPRGSLYTNLCGCAFRPSHA